MRLLNPEENKEKPRRPVTRAQSGQDWARNENGTAEGEDDDCEAEFEESSSDEDYGGPNFCVRDEVRELFHIPPPVAIQGRTPDVQQPESEPDQAQDMEGFEEIPLDDATENSLQLLQDHTVAMESEGGEHQSENEVVVL